MGFPKNNFVLQAAATNPEPFLQAAGSFFKHRKIRCNLHCVFRSVKKVAGEVIFAFLSSGGICRGMAGFFLLHCFRSYLSIFSWFAVLCVMILVLNIPNA